MAERERETGVSTMSATPVVKPYEEIGPYDDNAVQRAEPFSDDESGERPAVRGGQQAKELVGEAKAGARDVAERAKERGADMLSEQQQYLARQADGLADVLRRTAHGLREDRREGWADACERAADGVSRFGHTLGSRDARGAVDSVTDFARREPLLFLGGCVAAGFALSRFMKSSSERRDREIGGEREPRSRFVEGGSFVAREGGES